MQTEFKNVTAAAKANVYFDGRVVSHAITLEGGEKKTFGIIYPGEYSFDTAAPERMDITAGTCRVRLDGETEWRSFAEGSTFDIAGNSRFDIAVDDGVTQYICTFM